MAPLITDFQAGLIVWIPLGSAVLIYVWSMIHEHRKDKRKDERDE